MPLTVGDIRRAIEHLQDSDPVLNDVINGPDQYTANITGVEGATPSHQKGVSNADQPSRALWIHVEIVPMYDDGSSFKLTYEGRPVKIGEGWDCSGVCAGDEGFCHLAIPGEPELEITIDFDLDEDRRSDIIGPFNFFVDRDVRRGDGTRIHYASVNLSEDPKEILAALAMPAAEVIKRYAAQIAEVKTLPCDTDKL